MSESELEIKKEKEGDITVLTLSGPVDSASFNTFKRALDPLCREDDTRLIIDCTELSYINSKGIGLIASHHRSIMIRAGRIALFGLSTRILKTLDLLGLGNRLHIYPSREEALASFADG